MAAVAGLYGFGDDSRTVASRLIERQRAYNKDSAAETYVSAGYEIIFIYHLISFLFQFYPFFFIMHNFYQTIRHLNSIFANDARTWPFIASLCPPYGVESIHFFYIDNNAQNTPPLKSYW